MLSEDEVRRLTRWAKHIGAKVVFCLEDYKFNLVVGKFIHAEDKEGREVPWVRAFGSKMPWDVLSSFKVKEVRVKVKGTEKRFKRDEFKKYLKGII